MKTLTWTQKQRNKKFFNRLAVKRLLDQAALSQADLARELEISPAYLHDLLYGRRAATEYLHRTAQLLDVPVATIMATAPAYQDTHTTSA